jgi:hypothetical protein
MEGQEVRADLSGGNRGGGDSAPEPRDFIETFAPLKS